MIEKIPLQHFVLLQHNLMQLRGLVSSGSVSNGSILAILCYCNTFITCKRASKQTVPLLLLHNITTVQIKICTIYPIIFYATNELSSFSKLKVWSAQQYAADAQWKLPKLLSTTFSSKVCKIAMSTYIKYEHYWNTDLSGSARSI